MSIARDPRDVLLEKVMRFAENERQARRAKRMQMLGVIANTAVCLLALLHEINNLRNGR